MAMLMRVTISQAHFLTELFMLAAQAGKIYSPVIYLSVWVILF